MSRFIGRGSTGTVDARGVQCDHGKGDEGLFSRCAARVWMDGDKMPAEWATVGVRDFCPKHSAQLAAGRGIELLKKAVGL